MFFTLILNIGLQHFTSVPMIAFLQKTQKKIWPGSHMCHWLAQEQQTNCVFVSVWVCGSEKACEKLCRISYQCLSPPVCLFYVAFHLGIGH